MINTDIRQLNIYYRINKIAYVAIALFAAILLSGCSTSSSSQTTVSDRKVRQTQLRISDKCTKGSSSSLSLTGGTTTVLKDVLEHPDQLNCANMQITGYSKTGWAYRDGSELKIDSSTGQYKVHEAWKAAGAKYDKHVAVLNGRYLVAVKTVFGESGTYIDVTLENGTVIPAIVGDSKGMENSAIGNDAKYVHGGINGAAYCPVEFEVDPSYVFSNNQIVHAAVNGWVPEWDSTVKSITVYPNKVGDSDLPTQTDSSASSTGSAATDIQTPTITTHREWAEGSPDGHTDPTDSGTGSGQIDVDCFEKNRVYKKGYKANASNVHPNAEHMKDTSSRPSLKGFKYIVLHSTEGSLTETPEQVATYFISGDAKDYADAHFIVGRDGSIVQCVPLDKQGWHAGQSTEEKQKEFGVDSMNDYSIGIEICHKGSSGDKYTEEQLKAVSDLIAYIEQQKLGGVTDATTTDECAGEDDNSDSNYTGDVKAFKQGDYPDEYDSGCTIADAGCGLCSTTVALNIVLKKSMTPPEVATKLREYRKANNMSTLCIPGAGTAWGPWEQAVKGAYNVKITTTKSIEELKTALKAGKPVVIGTSGVFKINNDGGTYNSGGHCLCFYNYDGTSFYCADSSFGELVKYSESEFQTFLSNTASGGKIIEK